MKTLTHQTLYGNWATLLLATNSKGDIDYKRLENEIDVLISAGSNGIYSNGTAGEFYSQDEDEFLKISQLLAEKCEAAQMPFQISVSHMSPQISLSRLQAIKYLKPSAVQVILPDWFPVSIEESISFMQRMEAAADGIPLVLYNPPHAKVKLTPSQWMEIKAEVPSLIGVKVFDNGMDKNWYEDMKINTKDISVFIPGHHLATGILSGAHGAYSNVACLNPFAAQKWYNMIAVDKEAALDMQTRIQKFMSELITPFIVKHKYPNHACDRFMALVGDWADVGDKLRWPYRSIPKEYAEGVRREAKKIIPEFFT